jgi:hypothetical protein
MTSLPIACTLTPAEQPARLEQMEALAADALLTREPISGGLRVRLRNARGVEQRVRDFAAAEARGLIPRRARARVAESVI